MNWNNFDKIPLTLLIVLFSVQSFASEVCWKKTYGRGVGTIPQECDWVSQDKSGLLCYPKASPSTKTIAGVNWAICPAGYRDDGAYCRDAYWRGTLWIIASNCHNANKDVGGCEWSHAAWYPKCKPGYSSDTASYCSRCPPGWSRAVGTDSCYKPTKVFPPITPRCPVNQDYDAGLCYNKCNAGFYGVGPVCWGQCPKSKPIDCGAMCGTSALACAMSIGDMVLSVGQVVADAATLIASFGTSAAASGAKAAAKASAVAAMKALAKKTAENMGTKFLSMAAGEKKKTVKDDLNKRYPGLDPKMAEELAAMEAEPEKFDYEGFFTDIDPTGIAKAVKSLIHDICEVNVPTTTATTKPGTTPTTQPGVQPKIHNICEQMKKDPKYGTFVANKPGTSGFNRPTLLQFLDSYVHKDPGISKWGNLYVHSVLTLDCNKMRQDPNFNNIVTLEPIKWTDGQRNTAITIIANANPLSGEDKKHLISLLQGLSNPNLMEFLRSY